MFENEIVSRCNALYCKGWKISTIFTFKNFNLTPLKFESKISENWYVQIKEREKLGVWKI